MKKLILAKVSKEPYAMLLLHFLHNDEIIFGEPQTGKLVNYDEVKVVRLIV